MAAFNFIPYMKSIAVSLKELQHTDNDKHFHRIQSLPGMEELLSNTNFITGYQLLVLDRKSGRLDDSSRSDNLLDRKFNTFYVVKAVEQGNYEQLHTTLDACETIVRKILSKMFYDKRNNTNGLYNLNRSSVYYDAIGPFGQNFFGIMVSFSLLNAAGIIYNEDDWS